MNVEVNLILFLVAVGQIGIYFFLFFPHFIISALNPFIYKF